MISAMARGMTASFLCSMKALSEFALMATYHHGGVILGMACGASENTNSDPKGEESHS